MEAAKSVIIGVSIAFCSARYLDLSKSERDLTALNVHLVGSESDFEAMAMRSRSAWLEMNRALSVLFCSHNLTNRLKVAREIGDAVP